ncbi:MAG TPA: SpoIIE family protein phosphatase [Candidatus Obscuribacterales bacterium]
MEKMIGGTHLSFSVSDDSHIGELRRALKDLGAINAFAPELVGRAEIIASELATNLIKYTDKGGEILIGSLAVDDLRALEIISLDKGPGMSNPQKMLEDGVSTTGTLGGGLGAIKRFSDEFDMNSRPDKGTAMLSRIWNQRRPAHDYQPTVEVGGVMVAMPGEYVCGDRWAARRGKGTVQVAVTDGLGHGPAAAIASDACMQVFFEESASRLRPGDLLRRMHEATRHTNGAAAAIAELDAAHGVLTYSGVGNIATRMSSASNQKSCASMPGGLGFQLPKVREFTYPWTEEVGLLMNSDGITTSVAMDGLRNHHPSLIAAILYRDFKRGTDDATVVVVGGKKRDNLT